MTNGVNLGEARKIANCVGFIDGKGSDGEGGPAGVAQTRRCILAMADELTSHRARVAELEAEVAARDEAIRVLADEVGCWRYTVVREEDGRQRRHRIACMEAVNDNDIARTARDSAKEQP